MLPPNDAIHDEDQHPKDKDSRGNLALIVVEDLQKVLHIRGITVIL
jgi:hypothetical protein